MDVKIKRLDENAVIPKYAHIGDAGMDVVATSINVTDQYIEYGTGLAFEIPEGYCMLIFPRSSISKMDLTLANCVGILDSTYRGELKLRYKRSYRAEIESPNKVGYSTTSIMPVYCNNGRLNATEQYNVGDKVGQIIIMPYPMIRFVETDVLSETQRGDGGFGSTGK